MAHAGVIDRKALLEYKALLKSNYYSELRVRIERLETLTAQAPKIRPELESPKASEISPELASKVIIPRSRLTSIAMEELALSKYEKEQNMFLERQPVFSKGMEKLHLDAVRQDDSLEKDVVVEVRWIRKRYLDGPNWVQQIAQATSAYELLTGRSGRGVLIFVVAKASMKSVEELHYTKAELEKVNPRPEIVLYGYDDLGFTPAGISADLFAANLNT